MFNFKVLLLAFLLLATITLATRVTYSGKFAGNAVTSRTQTLAVVDDHKGEQILEHMTMWSDGKYTASRSRQPNMIIVVNVEVAASKGKASEMIQEMQTIVNNNYKPKSRSPSPDPARQQKSSSPHQARRLKSQSPRLAYRFIPSD